jgi:hypothetical protein
MKAIQISMIGTNPGHNEKLAVWYPVVVITETTWKLAKRRDSLSEG